MKRRIVGVVAAVALAAVGTLVLVGYVSAAEDRALAGERTVGVLVLKDKVDAGTAASDLAGHVKSVEVPAKVRAGDAVRKLSDLGEQVASADLSPGEQVVAGRFVEASELQQVGEVTVPDGSFQLTVALAPERAVGGLIEPGATVGVLASFEPFEIADQAPTPNSTHMILQKVLVTRVQRAQGVASDEDDKNQAPSGNLLVTLALSGANDVERVVFTAEHGSLWLAFEPKDAPEDGAQVVTRAVMY